MRLTRQNAGLRRPACIGVLGGTGPAATSHLHRLLVAGAQQRFGACQDFEFPPILAFNTPMPTTTVTGWADSDAEETRALLSREIGRLETAGADLIVPACNTISLLEDTFATKVPVLDLPAIVAEVADAEGFGRVGVLSSRLARDEGLHRTALAARGIEAIACGEADQVVVDSLILAAMGGSVRDQERGQLRRLDSQMKDAGAEITVLGCTELSLFADGGFWIDSAQVAADHALRSAYGETR